MVLPSLVIDCAPSLFNVFSGYPASLAWDHSPFSHKGYATVSFDGSLAVKDKFTKELLGTEINWFYWITEIRKEIDNMISTGKISANAKKQYLWALRKAPLLGSMFGVAIYPNISLKTAKILKEISRRFRRNYSIDESKVFGWSQRLSGSEVGIKGIADVPRWVEKTIPELKRT